MKKKILIIVILALALVVLGCYLFFVLRLRGFHNDRFIVDRYFCSDICPDYGGYYRIYYGIKTKEECDRIGGIPRIDPAWGGFIGCAPKY